MHAAVTWPGPTHRRRRQSTWVHHPTGTALPTASSGTAQPPRSDPPPPTMPPPAPPREAPRPSVPPIGEHPVVEPLLVEPLLFEPQTRPLRVDQQPTRSSSVPAARPAQRRLDASVVFAALVMVLLATGVAVGLTTL